MPLRSRAALALTLLLSLGCDAPASPEDAGRPVDAAPADASPIDAARDDSSTPDASTADAGADDAGARDARPMDASAPPDAGPPDAGPPAEIIEGFGARTRGALSRPEGFTECRVTHLGDEGPGSLRECVSAPGRLVRFDVAGEIVLERDLNLPYSFVTVDGSSAPAPGITIVQPGTIGTTIEARSSVGPAHDIVIGHLRFDGRAESHENRGDILGLDGESAAVHDIVIHHVTGRAATDGVFDIWEDVSDVTVTRCLILDTVTALHLSGGSQRRRITFDHNVFARNNERQIRLRHDSQEIEFINNVVYGWGWFEAGAAGLHIAYDSGESNPSINVLGNVFHHVSSTVGGAADDAVRFERGPDVGAVYFSGNITPPAEVDVSSTTSAPFDVRADARVTIDPAETLGERAVRTAGAPYPTADERALLEAIRAALP